MGINLAVQFQFKTDTSRDAIEKVSAKIQGMRVKCLHPDSKKPYIQSIQGGTDTAPDGLRQGTTHASVIQFDNPEDGNYYALKDPAHLAVMAELGPLVEKVQIVDLPSDDLAKVA